MQCIDEKTPFRIAGILAAAGFLLACNLVSLLSTPTSSESAGMEATAITAAEVSPTSAGMPTKATQAKPTRTPDRTATASAGLRATRRANQTQGASSSATWEARQAASAMAATQTARAATDTPTPQPTPTPTQAPKAVLVGPFRSIVSVDEVLPGRVSDLRVAPDGTLWVASESGVASLSGRSWTVHFPDDLFLFAGFDSTARFWMVSEDGRTMLVWDGSDWRSYGEAQGWLPIQAPFFIRLGEDLVTDPLGRLWLTTYQDVRIFDGEKWEVIDLEEMGFERSAETAEYEGFSLPALAVDLRGYVWVGNCDTQGVLLAGQGARWFDGQSWFGDEPPTSSGCVQEIVVDPQGDVWLGVDDVLWRFDPDSGNWSSTNPPPSPIGSHFGWVGDILLGAPGELWPEMAICGGAGCGNFQLRYRLANGNWSQVGEAGSYFGGPAFIDADGNAWLFSETTLYRVRSDAGYALEPVEDLDVHDAAIDGLGRLWLVAEYEGKTQVWKQVLASDD